MSVTQAGDVTGAVAASLTRPPSVARMFADRVAASPQREAFRYPVGDGWASLTWAKTAERVYAIAAGLARLGVGRGDRVAIAASTRLEWVLVDLGIMCAGAATTTIYPSTTTEDTLYILADSGAKVLVGEDLAQLGKVGLAWEKVPELTHVVLMAGDTDDERVLTLPELEQAGRDHLQAHPSLVDDAVAALGPDDLATLIYTSGTTGQPKGVELVHDCWTYEGVAIEALGLLGPDDLQYLWLPLSHAFGKVLQVMQLRIGFPTALDGDVSRIIDNLAVVEPTFMGAAPRIFEKVYGAVTTTMAAEGGLRARIFDWAFGIGRRRVRTEQAGEPVPAWLRAADRVADRLVFSTLRARFGSRLRYFISGSAALSPDLAEWFTAAGVSVLEGYGLTETSAATFVNRPDSLHIGTVGPPMPGTGVRIADDGEILLRGPGVMRGYHNLPEATAAAFTEDGWLRTGDIGELVDGTFLRITDRKTDMIKTSGGKFVAPQPIEIAFMASCPYASAIIVHGDRRNYVTALIALDREAVTEWARGHGLGDLPYPQLVATHEVYELIEGYVEALNARLARWETIKKFTILPGELAVESGELTPSLKVRRRAVERRYARELDAMYDAADVRAGRPTLGAG